MDVAPETVFSGRTVMVTGHTGFKGSWLSLWLDRLGARVVGYAMAAETAPNNFEASGLEGILAAHHQEDIRDAGGLQRTIEEHRPSMIFHLAAQALVRRGYEQPAETFDTNVMGTVNLLEAVHKLNHRCAIVIATSDKCYENREQVWGYREGDALGGHDPYSASKGAAEIVASAYRRSFFSPATIADHGVCVATARAGNVIGGGDWSPDRIVTDIVHHLQQGDSVPLRNPHAVRPWQHVLEPLGGYLQLAAALSGADAARYCKSWNLGPLPGDAVAVSELTDHFVSAWGSGSWFDASQGDLSHEATVLRLCVDQALSELGWSPQWSVYEAIERTSRWFKAYYAQPAAARSLCLDDIADYEAALTSRHTSRGSRQVSGQPMVLSRSA